MRTLTVFFLAVLAQATAASESPIQRRFFGSWKLICFEFTSTNGEVTYPRGRDAIGRITYDETGRMSVQIMQPGRPNFDGTDPLKAKPE